jgi:hypothetical protein
MGQVGSWAPDSSRLAFADLKLGGAEIATQLQMADVNSQTIQSEIGYLTSHPKHSILSV